MIDQKPQGDELTPETEPKKKRKIPWGMLYIIATILAMVLFGIFNREFDNVPGILKTLSPGFLAIAVAVTVAYFFFEGGIIRLLMRSQKIPMKLSSAMKIGLIGLYYSYITPSATGGQPMQAAYLRRDKIPVGISTAVLLMKFFCFQCAFVLCSAISFLCMFQKLSAENPGIIPFIVLGLAVNGGSIVFFRCVFIKPVLHGLCGFAKKLLAKLPFLKKRKTALLASVDKFERDFESYIDTFSETKKSVYLGIVLSIPQFLLQMSVIYFVFLAFGYRTVSYGEVFAVQSLLQVSVSFMPMPGASGAQEIGFSAFFRNYFQNNDLYAAVLIWRFFTYYLVVIAGALLVVVDQFLHGRAQQEEAD